MLGIVVADQPQRPENGLYSMKVLKTASLGLLQHLPGLSPPVVTHDFYPVLDLSALERQPSQCNASYKPSIIQVQALFKNTPIPCFQLVQALIQALKTLFLP